MGRSVRVWRDVVVALAFASLVSGPFWVGLTGLGVPSGAAAVVAIVVLGAMAWFAAPWFGSTASLLSDRPWVALAGAAALGGATLLTIGLSLFMHDSQRRQWSVQPTSDFYVAHACLTALTHALERAQHDDDIYAQPDRALRVAGFEVDAYLYTPPMLLVPAALSAVTTDFASMRRLWFGLQTLSTLAALLIVARYAGGRDGATATWAIPILWLAPPFLLNLQIENLQITALAMAMVGMVWLSSGRSIAGSALLSAAILTKLFPAVLLVYLIGLRRWRWIMLVLAWSVVFSVLSVAVFGVRPVWDYARALPEVLNGSATAIWTSIPGLAPSNQSVYGVTRKLVALGLDIVTPRVEQAVQMLFGIALLTVAAVAGFKTRTEGADSRSRLSHAIVWLALLNLASFRSPFLPDGYAYVGTLWLVTLILAARPRFSWRETLALAAAWILLTPIFGGRATTPEPFKLVLAVTLLTQGLVLAATVGAIWMQYRASIEVGRLPALPESLERLPA